MNSPIWPPMSPAGGHREVSRVKTPWEQQSPLGQGQASQNCGRIDSLCTEGAQSNSDGGIYFLLHAFLCVFFSLLFLK